MEFDLQATVAAPFYHIHLVEEKEKADSHLIKADVGPRLGYFFVE